MAAWTFLLLAGLRLERVPPGSLPEVREHFELVQTTAEVEIRFARECFLPGERVIIWARHKNNTGMDLMMGSSRLAGIEDLLVLMWIEEPGFVHEKIEPTGGGRPDARCAWRSGGYIYTSIHLWERGGPRSLPTYEKGESWDYAGFNRRTKEYVGLFEVVAWEPTVLISRKGRLTDEPPGDEYREVVFESRLVEGEVRGRRVAAYEVVIGRKHKTRDDRSESELRTWRLPSGARPHGMEIEGRTVHVIWQASDARFHYSTFDCRGPELPWGEGTGLRDVPPQKAFAADPEPRLVKREDGSVAVEGKEIPLKIEVKHIAEVLFPKEEAPLAARPERAAPVYAVLCSAYAAAVTVALLFFLWRTVRRRASA